MSAGRALVQLVLLLIFGESVTQRYGHSSEYDDVTLPDLSLPKELHGIKGYADLGGGPVGAAGLDFKPEGVVQGMVMGDIIRRVENLEILCQANKDEGTPRPTPQTLITKSAGGLKLNSLPEDDVRGSRDHLLVPGPETGETHPTSEQLQRSIDVVQDSVLLVATEQDKLRQEFSQLLSELKSVRSEMVQIKSGLNQSQSDVMTAVTLTESRLEAQGKRFSTLSANLSTIDKSLEAFHTSFYDLSNLNRSVVVAMKEQRLVNRRLGVVDRDVKKLKRDVGTLQQNWNRTMKETSKRLQRSYTVGKEMNRLQKQFHSMKARVVKIHGRKCESGRILFMNYPFAFGKWPQSRLIRFKSPFPQLPQITYGMTQLDVNYRYNTRARVRISRLTKHNFTLVCDGWYNTRLYRMEVSWMACLV